MMSTTGAGLAISGSSDQGNAAEAQYETKDEGTLGQQRAAQPQDEATETAAETAAQTAVVSGDTSGGSSLPFTGFFTIPLMVAGVALLTGGALLRWRSRE